MKSISLTFLRENLYKIVDQVILTGIPQEVKTKGTVINIVPQKTVDVFDNLTPHDTIIGDPDDLVNLSVYEWNEQKNL